MDPQQSPGQPYDPSGPYGPPTPYPSQTGVTPPGPGPGYPAAHPSEAGQQFGPPPGPGPGYPPEAGQQFGPPAGPPPPVFTGPGWAPPVPTPPRSGAPVGLIIGIVAVVLVVIVGGGIGAWLLLAEPDSERPTGVSVAPAGATADGGFTTGTGAVTVDWYLDYACPVCGDTSESGVKASIDQALAAGSITLVVHPLGMFDSYSPDRYSSRAASAAACAADQQVILPYSYALLAAVPAEGKATPDDNALIAAGDGIVADLDGFTDCVTSGRYAPWVEQTTSAAMAAGVTSVPHVLVNGVPFALGGDLATAIAEAA